jgi:hemerythrin-like domain-containing protein
MGITFGQKREHGYDDPVGMLADCHRRIERFLGDLQAMARTGTLDPAGRMRLEAALRYFTQALPKHTADEEESLFPRLRAHGQALAELAHLQADHDRTRVLHAEVDALGRAWLTQGSCDLARLQHVLGELATIHAEHIALEDALFPRIAGALTAEDLLACGREMAARRGVDFDAWQAMVRGLEPSRGQQKT